MLLFILYSLVGSPINLLSCFCRLTLFVYNDNIFSLYNTFIVVSVSAFIGSLYILFIFLFIINAPHHVQISYLLLFQIFLLYLFIADHTVLRYDITLSRIICLLYLSSSEKTHPQYFCI